MTIKKIVFRELSHTSTYTALGGIRFHDEDDSVIEYGNITTDQMTVGETDVFKVTASSTLDDRFNVLNAFRTDIPQSPLEYGGYWLTSEKNASITAEIKKGISSISKISFNIRPHMPVDRAISMPFKIDVFNESEEIIQTYEVTPENNVQDYVQVLITPELMKINKILIQSNSDYKYYNEFSWKSLGSTSTEQDYLDHGMNPEELSSIPASAWQELTNPVISYYTDDPDKEEITIETETEPFTIYDEMGDSMDVLYYTDDPDKEEADLEITADYSPLDEFEEFEVVTWTDDDETEFSLNLTALPRPQFITMKSAQDIYGYLQGFSVELSGERDDAYRILLSDDGKQWKTWSGSSFVDVDASDDDVIRNQGIRLSDISEISDSSWKDSFLEQIFIGVFIDEEVNSDSFIESISIEALTPSETTSVNEAKLYILNTRSIIDVEFAGSTVTGYVDDADLGRVQYRIILNDDPYYPSDGSFTKLQPSPLNISTTFTNRDILIDEENTLRIEFQDYWGSTDYWETTFVGTYSGLLFIDETGEYYSSDIGEVLKYLDFGVIIAGQTTIDHKVTLRNTYGYPVENVKIVVNRDEFPEGMDVEFSLNENTFEPMEEISFNEVIENGESKDFYIRLTTQLGITPSSQGSFDIVVTGDRVID